MKIEIKKYVKGDIAISYDEGKKCYDYIKSHIHRNESIILDFSNVQYVIIAFLNPIISHLITENDEDIMNRVKITNANEEIIEKIDLIKDMALLQRQDFTQTK